jgi:hypothetical protein
LTFAVVCPGEIPFKNTFCRSAVVFCACEVIQSLSEVFCVVRAGQNLDFRLVIKKRIT